MRAQTESMKKLPISAEREGAVLFESLRSQESETSQPRVKKRKISTLRLYTERKSSVRSVSRPVAPTKVDTVQSPFIERLQQFVMSYMSEKEQKGRVSDRAILQSDETEESSKDIAVIGDQCTSQGSSESNEGATWRTKSILKKPSIERLESGKKVTFNSFNVVVDSENHINQVMTQVGGKPVAEKEVAETNIPTEAPKLDIQVVNMSSDTLVEVQKMAEPADVFKPHHDTPDKTNIGESVVKPHHDTSAKTNIDQCVFEPHHDTPDETNIDDICNGLNLCQVSLTSVECPRKTELSKIQEQIAAIDETMRDLAARRKQLKKQQGHQWGIFDIFRHHRKSAGYSSKEPKTNPTADVQIIKALSKEGKVHGGEICSDSPLFFTEKMAGTRAKSTCQFT